MFGWIHTIWVWNGKTLLLSFHDFIFPHPSPIILLLRLCHLDRDLFLQSNNLLSPLHVEFCWDIGITPCYQGMPLVTCCMNSWRRVYITRACSLIWFTRKRLLLVTDSWCHMNVTFHIPSFDLFQNVTVYGCSVDLTQWNKGWSIPFWSSCRWACWNIFDSGFCNLCVVLHRKYKFFTVILELHKVILNHYTTNGVTFW